MGYMKVACNNDRGSALLITLAIMLMLGIIGSVAFQTADTEKQMSFNQVDLDRSRLVAEAGLQLSLEQLQNDFDWRAGYVDQSFGDGLYTVSITDKTTDPALGDTVVVQSTGFADEASSTLEAFIVSSGKNPFKYAVYAKDFVSMENHACTNSYNSDSTLAESQINDGGNVGTMGTITMANNTTINGDAMTTGGSITTSGSASVNGDKITTAPAEDMSIVSDSEYTYMSTHNNNATGFAGVYQWNPGPKDLLIKANKTATLTSGTYYFTSVHLENQATLNIAPGAKVEIYLTGDMLVENNSKMNSGGKPSNMIFYSKGSNLFLKNNIEFTGGFYGPKTVWTFENSADVRGSIIVKSATIKNNTCIHYDRKMGEELGGGDAQIVACHEI